MLQLYGPLITRICKNSTHQFSNAALRSAAVLALCKLMLVSEEFCASHLSLLFTIVEREPRADVRCNVVVCLGDLVARHPNTVDPWLQRLFACLAQPSAAVRRHALMVLTHLILNDQIKAKTHVSKMAFCLEDRFVCVCLCN
jgi:condensin complex subunit 1